MTGREVTPWQTIHYYTLSLQDTARENVPCWNDNALGHACVGETKKSGFQLQRTKKVISQKKNLAKISTHNLL
jgi:hypothetical protein